jgi:uncharacterized protein YndB with AHSA1/START domain
MLEPSVIHSTFVIERRYPYPAQRVFAAFADPKQKRRWFGEGDHHDVEQFDMDFRVGGRDRMQYRFKEGSTFPGVVLSNDFLYQDIVSDQRIVTSSTMTLGGKRISCSLVTIELLPTATGTDLICTHQGAFFEGSGGPQMREAGWRKLFDNLETELAR